MSAKVEQIKDASLNPELNGVEVDGERVAWAVAFPRNYDVIFDHPHVGLEEAA